MGHHIQEKYTKVRLQTQGVTMGETTELVNPNGFYKIMGQREQNSNNHPPQKILMIQIRRSDSRPMVT